MATSKKTTLPAMAGSGPSPRNAELERQCYDVLHVMRMRDEGKPFKTHFDNADGMQAADADHYAPRLALALEYLKRMQEGVKTALVTRLNTTPMEEALQDQSLRYYWGSDEDALERKAMAWFRHAGEKSRAGQTIPTVAFYLMQYDPPLPFDFEASRLWSLPYSLTGTVVDGPDWPFHEGRLKRFQLKRAA